jgi:putative DNA primase/helicase
MNTPAELRGDDVLAREQEILARHRADPLLEPVATPIIRVVASSSRVPVSAVVDFSPLESLTADADPDAIDRALMAVIESMPPNIDRLSRETAQETIRTRYPQIPLRMLRSAFTPSPRITTGRPARIPAEEQLTEAGAAERFARLHGDDLRYDHARQRWLLWDAHRWRPDTDGAVTRLALQFARAWQHEAIDYRGDRARADAALKAARQLERRSALDSMLALARDLHPIADAGDAWDADAWLIGVPNGVIDLRTGDLREGRREDRITMSTGVPFEATATCPRWTQFVGEVFNDDADLIAFIQRAVGYSMTGDTREQCLFLGHGTGANGKGTFTGTLSEMLGGYSYNMPFATIESQQRAGIPNDLAALRGRRFVISSETNDGTHLNEARVKALTGCDPITARFLHCEFFTFTPVAKFWLAVNHKPIVRDDSYGFWRRMRLIPFARTFDVDRGLADRLRAELPGILAWAVRGALVWQANGLFAPTAVIQATEEYEMDSDPLVSFLSEACEMAGQSRARDLYRHYCGWADLNALSPKERLSSTAFGLKMAERFGRKRTSLGVTYLGVSALRPQ